MMASISFDDVLKLAEQLPEQEQNRLIYRLRLWQAAQQPPAEAAPQAEPLRDLGYLKRGAEYVDSYRSPTREELLAEAEALRQQPARAEDRLLGRYASPQAAALSAEEFHAQIHAIASEWEQELDDYLDDDS